MKNAPTGSSSLKSKIDELDTGKFETTPVELSGLSNVVKNDFVKNTQYNAKIKIIKDKIPDITNVATKTTLNTEMNELKGKIPRITNLAAAAAHNAKINEFKDKIFNITNLVSTTVLTSVENKMSNVSNLIKKLTITQKFMKLKIKILIRIMINILLHQELRS